MTAAPLGSKTVFGDDGQVVASHQTPAAAVKVPKAEVKKPAASKGSAVQAEILHPSWLAKRAAASKLAELANGKKASKITFDDQ